MLICAASCFLKPFIPSTLKTGPYVYRCWDPPLCTVPPGAIHIKGWPLLRMCECVRVWGEAGEVVWETSVGPLSLAAARKGEDLESQRRGPGPKV